MAGWIKMRAGLLTSPKVVAITSYLSRHRDFRWWLTPEDQDFADRVTEGALRCVTCALLMSVWSCARDFGKADGDDLILEHLTLEDLDKIGGAPGLGQAMAQVGWAIECAENGCVILPNFNEHNTPATPAERQSAYRARKRESDENVTNRRNNSATPRYANVAPREEKRREEKKEESPPTPPSGGIERDPVVEAQSAKKIVQEYQAGTLNRCSPHGGESAVRALLDANIPADDLIRSVRNYLAWAKASGKGHTPAARNFFASDGEWAVHRERSPPVIQSNGKHQPAEKTPEEIRREVEEIDRASQERTRKRLAGEL